MSHQLCIAHVRNYVSRRARSILEQAEREYDEKDGKLAELAEDLKVLKEVLEEMPEEGGRRGSGGCTENTCGQPLREGRAMKPKKPRPLTG